MAHFMATGLARFLPAFLAVAAVSAAPGERSSRRRQGQSSRRAATSLFSRGTTIYHHLDEDADDVPLAPLPAAYVPNDRKINRDKGKAVALNEQIWPTTNAEYQHVETLKQEGWHLLLYRARQNGRPCVVKRVPLIFSDGHKDEAAITEYTIAKRMIRRQITNEYVVNFYTIFTEDHELKKEEGDKKSPKIKYAFFIMEDFEEFPELESLLVNTVKKSTVQDNKLSSLLKYGKLQMDVVRSFARQMVEAVYIASQIHIRNYDMNAGHFVVVSARHPADANEQHARVVLDDFSTASIRRQAKSDDDNTPLPAINHTNTVDLPNEKIDEFSSVNLATIIFHMLVGRPIKSYDLISECKEPAWNPIIGWAISSKNKSKLKAARNFVCQLHPGVEMKTWTFFQIVNHPWLMTQD